MKLEEANKLSLQEAMDYAVKKIVEQGTRCMSPCPMGYEPVCSYGNDEGQHCAVGWLLDEGNALLMDFDDDVEALIAACNENIDTENFLPDVIEDNSSAFATLQYFHDATTKEKREIYLKELKIRQGIDVSAPQYNEWVGMGAGTVL